MKNAHIKSGTAKGEQGAAALLRRLAACCLIGVAAMSVAHAGPRDRDRDNNDNQPQQQRGYARAERQAEQRQRADERQPRQYDARAEEGRRYQQEQQQQAAQNDNGRRGGRLTPDERRDLRRQINEAGADIYPSRRQR
jgi:predicted lipid-binding transport protein (Tim44 family)